MPTCSWNRNKVSWPAIQEKAKQYKPQLRVANLSETKPWIGFQWTDGCTMEIECLIMFIWHIVLWHVQMTCSAHFTTTPHRDRVFSSFRVAAKGARGWPVVFVFLGAPRSFLWLSPMQTKTQLKFDVFFSSFTVTKQLTLRFFTAKMKFDYLFYKFTNNNCESCPYCHLYIKWQPPGENRNSSQNAALYDGKIKKNTLNKNRPRISSISRSWRRFW